MAPFLIVDIVFLGANLLKLLEGGWLPVVVGAALLTLMMTWQRGAQLLRTRSQKEELPLADYLPMLERKSHHRVPGTAVL